MRRQSYRAFELLAWSAAAWCVCELTLRLATGTTAGAGDAALLAACAAGSAMLAHSRRRSLAPPGALSGMPTGR